MEDERFKELLTIAANFDLGGVPEWEKAVGAEYEQYRENLRLLRLEFRRAFPEWHFPDGKFVGNNRGDWGNGDAVSTRDGLHRSLQFIWEIASNGDIDAANGKLQFLMSFFVRRMKKADEEKRNALTKMVETLEWLRNRLKSLKVCENPRCVSTNQYFFRIYSNDKYCCSRCIATAKELRRVQRDAEAKKPPKAYIFTEKRRMKMAIAAQKRWEKYREKTGKPKFGR